MILDIFVHSLENRSSIGDEQLISMEYSKIEVIVFGDGSILCLDILLYSLKSLPSAFRVQGC